MVMPGRAEMSGSKAGARRTKPKEKPVDRSPLGSLGEHLSEWPDVAVVEARPGRRFTTPQALRLELMTLVAVVLALGRLIPSFGDLLHGFAKYLLP